jgi:hypothetical protein
MVEEKAITEQPSSVRRSRDTPRFRHSHAVIQPENRKLCRPAQLTHADSNQGTIGIAAKCRAATKSAERYEAF